VGGADLADGLCSDDINEQGIQPYFPAHDMPVAVSDVDLPTISRFNTGSTTRRSYFPVGSSPTPLGFTPGSSILLQPVISNTMRKKVNLRRPLPNAETARQMQSVFRTQPQAHVHGRYPKEVWESHKPTIKRLYLHERRPLKEVIQIMAQQYGFSAS
jgi:Clr5 domain